MAELTDAQWATEAADVFAGLAGGTITEAQAAQRLTTATQNWPTRSMSNARLYEEVVSFLAKLNGLLLTAGPPPAVMGEVNTFAYDTVNGDLYGPKTGDAVDPWGDPVSLVGPAGLSAKAIVIAAGLLPEGATDAQFATWLADSQKAAVQPLVDDAEAARDAAQAAETEAAASASAAAGHADATEADRTAVAADKANVADDRAAVEAAMPDLQAAVTAAAQTALDRDATAADAVATAADRAAVEAVVPALEAAVQAAAQTEADAAATAADRLATAADAQTTGADRTAVSDDKALIDAIRAVVQTLRDEAQQFRDEAGEIAGGDFLTEAAADGLYRKLGVLLNIPDVDGLAAALASKATPADVNAAVQAIIGMAPADLDTLKEIADRLVGAEGDYAALVAVISGKASQGDLDALAALLADKADQGALDALAAVVAAITVPTKATGAEVRTATDDTKFLTPKALSDADAFVPVAASGAFTLDFAAGRNFIVTLSAASTMNPPTNMKDGQSGTIYFVQNATGSRTLGLATAIKKFGSYTLSTAANAVDRCGYVLRSGVLELTALEKGLG